MGENEAAYLRAKCNKLIDLALQMDQEIEKADARIRELEKEKATREQLLEEKEELAEKTEADMQDIGQKDIAIIYEAARVPASLKTILSILCVLVVLLTVCALIIWLTGAGQTDIIDYFTGGNQ